MDVLVVSNQHPHEEYADTVRGYVEDIAKSRNSLPNLQFHRIPDEEYKNNLQSLSNAILRGGICERISKNTELSTQQSDEINEIIEWAKDKTPLDIDRYETINIENILNRNLSTILKALPEINIVCGRNNVGYDERNKKLCRKFSADVVLDIHNSRLTSKDPFKDIEMFGYARGNEFERINEQLYQKYPDTANTVCDAIEELSNDCGFLIEIPAIPTETDLSRNGLAYLLLDRRHNTQNPIFSSLHQYNPKLNQKHLMKHGEQVIDVIQMLINY